MKNLILRLKKLNFLQLIRRVGSVLYGLIFAVLVLIAGLVAVSAVKIPGNYKLLTVQSGSMEPAIHKGAIVIVKPQSEYKQNDVITVSEPANPKMSLTHRITGIEELEEKTFYTTKGDANDTDDTEKRPKSNVVGKVLFSIPLIGYLISYAKTQNGLIFLVIIPATIIIYNELLSIKNEAKRLIKEKKKRKLTLKENIEVEIGAEEIEVESKIRKLVKKLKNLIKKK